MSKKKLPWFPCYPQDWLEDTRHMTDTQRCLYWDFLCLVYVHDGVVRDFDKWIAFELHTSLQKWRTVRKFLVADGKIVETPDGLTNNRAAKVCHERKARSENHSAAATGREIARHQEPELPFGINKGRAQLRVVPDHNSGVHSDPQILKVERREELKRQKPMPPDLRQALVDQVGQQRADAYIDEFYDDPFGAEGAKSIRAAFPGYLEKVCKVVLIGWNDGPITNSVAEHAASTLADYRSAFEKRKRAEGS